jgi:hypothetical protein
MMNDELIDYQSITKFIIHHYLKDLLTLNRK